MADDFGLRIGVEGEKQFKDALRDINQSFKVLGSEMTLVTSQFDKNDRSVQALTARNEVLNKEIDGQRQKIETLRAALQNSSESFGENDRRTQNWQIQLNKAQAELNGMERELGNNEKALEAVGREENQAADGADRLGTEVKNAANQADDAGNRFEALGGVLKGVGVAMGAVFVAVGAATVAAGKALTDMTVGASKYADNILTLSSVTGISTDSLQAYSYAAELVDVSLETMTSSMSRNVRAMSSARDGTGAAAQAYRTLGISVTDTNGSLRDSEAVYWEAIDALGNIANETERDALAMQLFGKSARDLNPLIAQGSAGIAELTAEAQSMGAVMSGDALAALGQFDDTMQRLKSGSEAAKNALGMVLLPQLTQLGTSGVDLLGNFTRGLNEANGDWDKISEVIGNTVGDIVGLIMEQLPQIIQISLDIVSSIGGAIMESIPILVDAASQITMTLLDGVISAIPGLTEGALQLVLALVSGIVQSLPALVNAAAMMISTLVTGIGQALPRIIPAAVSAVARLVQGLVQNLPMLLDVALQLIVGLAQGLLSAIPELVAALPAIITAITDFVIGSIPQIINAGIQLLVSLVQALPEIITAIVAAIPQIINGITTAVIGSIPLIIDAGIKLLVALIQALPEIIATIVTALPQIITAIVGALIGNIDRIIFAGVQLFVALIQNLPTIIIEIVKAVPQIVAGLVNAFGAMTYRMVEAGANLIRGLWNGIMSVKDWILGRIKGFCNDIVKGIEGFFGIKSPSAVFAGIGVNMAQGLGVGFAQTMSDVRAQMERSIPTTFDTNIQSTITTDLINGMMGGLSSALGSTSGQNIVLQVNLDGKTIAQTIFDPLRDVSRQRGVSLG